MPNLSLILTQSFIDSFHYCDENGHRSYRFNILKFFYNTALTTDLENLANRTTAAMRNIHETCLADKEERVAEIINIINSAIESACQLRLHYGSVFENGVGENRTKLIVPYKQSKFENELKTAMDNMRRITKRTLLNKASGRIDNLDDYRDVIHALGVGPSIMRNNSLRQQ